MPMAILPMGERHRFHEKYFIQFGSVKQITVKFDVYVRASVFENALCTFCAMKTEIYHRAPEDNICLRCHPAAINHWLRFSLSLSILNTLIQSTTHRVVAQI